jgi:hypothetical protein
MCLENTEISSVFLGTELVLSFLSDEYNNMVQNSASLFHGRRTLKQMSSYLKNSTAADSVLRSRALLVARRAQKERKAGTRRAGSVVAKAGNG